jgi:predicted DNA-binding protein (UPF0251 family)
MSALEEVELTIDELEALRLADLEGLYQEEAAARMEVSRATFARIVETARLKVATALVHGHALRIGGGPVSASRGPPLRIVPHGGPAVRHGPATGLPPARERFPATDADPLDARSPAR